MGVCRDDCEGEICELVGEPLDIPHIISRIDEGSGFLADGEVGDHFLELARFVYGVDVVGEFVDLESGVADLDLPESLPGFAGEVLVPFLGDDEVFPFGGHDS